jgi:hypothetical protein
MKAASQKPMILHLMWSIKFNWELLGHSGEAVWLHIYFGKIMYGLSAKRVLCSVTNFSYFKELVSL